MNQQFSHVAAIPQLSSQFYVFKVFLLIGSMPLMTFAYMYSTQTYFVSLQVLLINAPSKYSFICPINMKLKHVALEVKDVFLNLSSQMKFPVIKPEVFK